MRPRLILVLASVASLVACGTASPILHGTLGSGGIFADSIQTIPTSRHVTGLPYPVKCTLRNSGGHALPDRVCTPGSADGEVMAPSLGHPSNEAGTICTPGWSQAADALPSELVPVKAAATTAYNVRGQAVLVHLVPLNLGGSNDTSNLFLMTVDDAKEKENVDATISKAVCAGTVGLRAAQNVVATNWTTALQVLGLE